MSKQKKGSHFWPSYSDLMTSLFFLMLVMFVLTIISLRNTILEAERQRRISEEQYRNVQQIQEAVKRLPVDYFEEDAINKRWILKESYSPNFKAADFDIRVLNDTTRLVEVGNSLMRVIKRLNIMKEDTRYKDMDIT